MGVLLIAAVLGTANCYGMEAEEQVNRFAATTQDPLSGGAETVPSNGQLSPTSYRRTISDITRSLLNLDLTEDERSRLTREREILNMKFSCNNEMQPPGGNGGVYTHPYVIARNTNDPKIEREENAHLIGQLTQRMVPEDIAIYKPLLKKAFESEKKKELLVMLRKIEGYLTMPSEAQKKCLNQVLEELEIGGILPFPIGGILPLPIGGILPFPAQEVKESKGSPAVSSCSVS